MGHYRLLSALALLLCAACTAASTTEVEIVVPDAAVVKGQDAYICTTVELPQKPYKLVGVQPLAKQEVVHHILLFGCDVPYLKPEAGKQSVWDCKSAPTCGGFSETIMYGWGRNAPRLDLPAGVGFSVGMGSAVKWVVAQVHYLGAKPPGDKSGVKLMLQDTPVPYSAGLLSYASWFSIPPRKKSHLVKNDCCYRGFQPLVTFAVRVHTHTMGREVYMMRAPSRPGQRAEVIASGDPQQPQGFNPTKAKVLWPGDRLTVACNFDSTGHSEAVGAGPTHEHEMCNMYLMVYSPVPHIEMCSDGMSMVDEHTPGNMPRTAALVPDPFPLWKPPQPKQAWNKSVLGNVASVTLGPDGSVWALHRGGRVWDENSFDAENRFTGKDPIQVDVVVQMHPATGQVLRTWGSGRFFMPHMITVDRDNNVWVTDVALQQALKFTAAGQLLMVVGKSRQPGHSLAHLCKPTQVAVLSDGSFMVSDGYCNSRVMRYKADGTFQAVYQLRAADPHQSMAVAHSVVVDECERQVFVADRDLNRVHKFQLDEPYAHIATVSLKNFGQVWSLLQGPYGRILALTWSLGKDAQLVDVDTPAFSWKLPNSTQMWPHDMALGPAPLHLTGAADRLLSLYVAPLCAECGPLDKYVLFPHHAGVLPTNLTKPVVVPAQQRPLAHLGVGHSHASHQPAQIQHKEEDAQDYVVTKDQEDVNDEQEEEVEKERTHVDEEVAEEMEQPKLQQELQAELETVKQELDGSGSQDDEEVDDYKMMHSAMFVESSQGFWSGMLTVVIVGVLLGVFVLLLSVHLLHKQVMDGKPRTAHANGAGVSAGAARSGYQAAAAAPPQHSIGGMLEKDEEDVAFEGSLLLQGGLRSS